MAPRWLAWVILLAACLQIGGIARTELPAQDGLKFIRVARDFQQQPWELAVRGSDQHPLYPALIALAQPVIAAFTGPGPDSWRLAAQGVASLGTIALILPLFLVARTLFDERTALLAALFWVLLPFPAEVGRDTLSDSLALLAFTMALLFGLRTLCNGSTATAIACGLVSGVGYLARPEVAVLPMAVLITAGARGIRAVRESGLTKASRLRVGRFAGLAVAFLAMVGAYALIKGEVSEKLALRQAAAIPTQNDRPRTVVQGLPPGLDDPHWDFAPKEESDDPGRLSFAGATGRVAQGWAEGLGWGLAALAILGMFRARAGQGRDLILIDAVLFTGILIHHGMTLGYISGRHTLTLVILALPWAAAGTLALGRRAKGWLPITDAQARRIAWAGLALAILTGAALQVRPGHPSRWGHGAAGRWLAEHAEPGAAALDTRGWASFVWGGPSYDYWHVRQALTDARLAYLIVGADELNAPSRRAETLRAIVAFACEPAAGFPARKEGMGQDILIFRYSRPESWEGIVP